MSEQRSDDDALPEDKALRDWRSELDALRYDVVTLLRIFFIYIGALLARVAVEFAYGGQPLPVLLQLTDTVVQVGFFIGALTQLTFIIIRFVRAVQRLIRVVFLLPDQEDE